MTRPIETTLGNLIEFQRGFDLPKSKFIEGEYPVQSSNGILGYHNEYKVEGPGITIGRSGTVGLPHLLECNFYPHNTSLFVKDFKDNDVNYIYYLLKSLKLGDKKSGSGVPTMNRNHLHPLKIKAHLDNTVQKSIAKVLSDIDSKIECNNKINTELEMMANLIYKNWFIQFDFPDVNGRLYKTSGGKMVYNEELKREIPYSWIGTSIGKILHTELGGTPSTKVEEYWNGNIPWLNSGEIANFPIVESEERITSNAIDNSATALMPKDTCVLSITRHLRPSILAVEACANQSVVGIYESEELKSSYLYPYLKNEIPRLMSLRTGAQQPHINKGIVDASPIVVPPSAVLKAYYEKVSAIYVKINNGAFQNKELERLRDWLLPMLMNGQVTVKD
jgi:type I restriction enzyme, S subunit